MQRTAVRPQSASAELKGRQRGTLIIWYSAFANTTKNFPYTLEKHTRFGMFSRAAVNRIPFISTTYKLVLGVLRANSTRRTKCRNDPFPISVRHGPCLKSEGHLEYKLTHRRALR